MRAPQGQPIEYPKPSNNQSLTDIYVIHKPGSGTLPLAGANTYGGNTALSAGTLSLSPAVAGGYLADGADLYLTTGATLYLNTGATTDTIRSLYIDGVPQAAGEWGSAASGAANQSDLFTGSGKLNVTTLGAAATYSISGTVTENGVALAGVTVSDGTRTSDPTDADYPCLWVLQFIRKPLIWPQGAPQQPSRRHPHRQIPPLQPNPKNLENTTMKSSPTSIQARLRLPGTAALPTPSHDIPGVMPPPKPLRRLLTGLAAATAVLGLSHAAPIAVSSYTYDRGSIGWGSDTGNRLTDGVIPSITFWSDPSYVGFNGTWPQITFDLGTSNNLGTIDLSYWADSTSIFGPQNTLGDRLKISVSDDNVTYSTPVQYSPFTGPLDQVVTSSMNVTGMSARYVRLDFQKNANAAWLFFGEVAFSSAASGTTTTTTLARHTGTDTSSTYGASLSFDAAVNPATATGTVELYDGDAAGTLIGTGTLSSGACTITPASTALVLGTHDKIVAVYGGDSTHAGSTSVALSPAQVVNPGPAVTLLVTTPPSGGQPGAAWETQAKVRLLDAFGNTANSSAPITLAITTATPASGGPGTLSGTTTVSAVNGVATFSGLSINTAGVGYRLTATTAGLTPADSALFTISSGTVLYSSTDCSGQFPRITLDFTPVAGHVYRLSFSLNNPVGSLYNANIDFSPYAAADNTYNDSVIDGFYVGNLVTRQYNNGSAGEASFTSDTLSGHNGYRGPAGELDSNYEVVLDTTGTTWTTATSMSSGLGTVSGSVRTAIGTVKSVQVRVRDPGPAIATISNFRLTDTSSVVSSPYDTWGNGSFAHSFTDKDSTHDPDGDGLTSFQEFAFGLDPTSGASVNPVTPLIGGQFTYTRYAASGLTYTVEYSNDLAGWDTAATTDDGGGGVDANGVQTVTVTVTVTTLPLNGKLFVRVRAE